MIIPTAEYDPMFACDDVPFRDKMLDYISREFSDLPGPHTRQRDGDDNSDKRSIITIPFASTTRGQAA